LKIFETNEDLDKKLNNRFLENAKPFGFDNFYRSFGAGKLREIAKLSHKASGRCLRIYSD